MVVSAILVIGMSFLYSELVFKLQFNWKYEVYSLFGDPIGEEVESVVNKFDKLNFDKRPPKLLHIDSLLKLTSFEQLSLKDSMIIKQKLYTDIEDSLKSILSFIQFKTTKEFLLLQISYVNSIRNFYEKCYLFMSNLEKIKKGGIELFSLKNDVENGFRTTDSLYPKISYIFELKPDADGNINVNQEDTRLFREVMKIAERNNYLAEKYVLIMKESNNLQKENNLLYDMHIRYLDQVSHFLELKSFLYKFRLIAPNPY